MLLGTVAFLVLRLVSPFPADLDLTWVKDRIQAASPKPMLRLRFSQFSNLLIFGWCSPLRIRVVVIMILVFHILLWTIGFTLLHALYFKKQVMRLFREGFFGSRILIIPKGSGGGVGGDLPQKALLLSDEDLILIIADFGPTDPVAIFHWFTSSDLEYLIVFAEWEELYLLLGEVIKIHCKLPKQF